ncbi:MAG: penicillin-binding protein 1C [Bacteroidota bacterium]|nr:penicillin-binding protein 1C [Bacteroidota bacterium]MDX5429708.1 penicillin-binding protein 1C [Bacteroidota bacterium]MDX5468489.1 penicillin-binding protein 1C [Bacteroidota bacterium]
MKMRIHRILRWARNGFIIGFFLFLVLDGLFPMHPEIAYSKLIYSEEGRPMAAYLSSDDKWRLCLKDEEITDQIKEAFLIKEDRFFYYHPGFNPVSMLRAGIQNIRGGKRISGASTITMQLVRLIHPRERTYSNKLLEVFQAFQLEWHYSKDEILRMYLNLVPYGGNIEGIKSASLLYFQCLPEQLSPAQIATLSVVPNRPGTWRLRAGNEELLEARNTWLERFFTAGWVNETTYLSARQEALNIERKPWEQVAPHLCRRLNLEYQSPNIHTHIRYGLQKKCEALVRQYAERLKTQKITNASIIIIHNPTRKVIAYVGSADFNDKENQGEVDGVLGIRSPGSTLKPFLYGLSMEAGILTPKTILYDVPSYYAGYTPENYDLSFNGALTVQSALAKSLNIPAVTALQQYGVKDFVRKMSEVDMKQIKKQEKDLGLSMILGGCGVQLEPLTNAYASLAN